MGVDCTKNWSSWSCYTTSDAHHGPGYGRNAEWSVCVYLDHKGNQQMEFAGLFMQGVAQNTPAPSKIAIFHFQLRYFDIFGECPRSWECIGNKTSSDLPQRPSFSIKSRPEQRSLGWGHSRSARTVRGARNELSSRATD